VERHASFTWRNFHHGRSSERFSSTRASLVIQISVIASLPLRSLAFLGPVRDRGVRWTERAELNRKLLASILADSIISLCTHIAARLSRFS